MAFPLNDFPEPVAEILALDGSGERLMPLIAGGCSNPKAAEALRAADPLVLFAGAPAPREALAGLWLYFSAFDEAHAIVQSLDSPEAAYWHAILHRQEPDAANASYWFRQAGPHPIFGELAGQAAELGFPCPGRWDPHAFVDYCLSALRPGGVDRAGLALKVQRLEWQLLFRYCALAVRG